MTTVGEHVNTNLRMLHQAFGGDAAGEPIWLFEREDGDEFAVDGVEFVCNYASGSTAERFYIVKSVPHVRQYVELCKQFTGGVFVELGIAEGGSAALAALTAAPSKLVALDIEPERLAALDEFVAARGLDGTVTAHYGVDQSDSERLEAILDEDLQGQPVDIVFDDASHQIEPTRRSFEVLFPRLRPGGIFVIEDWNSDHIWRHSMSETFAQMSREERRSVLAEAAAEPANRPAEAPERPFSDLVIELVLLGALPTDVVRSVSVNGFEVRVERGAADLGDDFRLSDHVKDWFGYLP